MPLEPLSFPPLVPKPAWAVEGMFPLGHVSLVFAPAGVGKTRLVSYLAAQVAREDGHFLGRAVKPGRVLILDADDPTGFGYQTWVNRFLNGYPDAKRERIQLRAVQQGLTPEDVNGLADELMFDPPVLVILDTFASAFIGLDILKAHHVQNALTGLAGLAKSLNTCVLVLDHVGKLQPGETVAGRGAYGSAAKSFSPRAVFALDRVPPKEVEGQDVLRLTCTKMSYAVEPPPIGLTITLEQNDSVARVQVVKLPESSSLTDRAKAAMLQTLKASRGEPVPRKVLLGVAIQGANCTERWAARALDELEVELGSTLEVVYLGGRGNPKAYLMNSSGFDEHPTSSNQTPSRTQETPFDELKGYNKTPEVGVLDTSKSSSNQQNAVQDEERFDEVGTSSNQNRSSNEPATQSELFALPETPSPSWPIMVARKKT